MNGMLFSLLLTVHVLIGLGIIGLVLMQHGKGADMGAAFGSGASGSLFGSSGSANFLTRTTAVLATIFFITSIALSYLASNKAAKPASVMDGVTQTVPAVNEQNQNVVPPASTTTVSPTEEESKAQAIPK